MAVYTVILTIGDLGGRDDVSTASTLVMKIEVPDYMDVDMARHAALHAACAMIDEDMDNHDDPWPYRETVSFLHDGRMTTDDRSTDAQVIPFPVVSTN